VLPIPSSALIFCVCVSYFCERGELSRQRFTDVFSHLLAVKMMREVRYNKHGCGGDEGNIVYQGHTAAIFVLETDGGDVRPGDRERHSTVGHKSDDVGPWDNTTSALVRGTQGRRRWSWGHRASILAAILAAILAFDVVQEDIHL
jgi:hypothetical protein